MGKYKCEHNRERSICADCWVNDTGGTGLCVHLKRRCECRSGCGNATGFEQIKCECGRFYMRRCKVRHYNTEIHKRLMNKP